MVWQNLRFAWRSILSQPGFSFSAIIALAVAIGLNTAMFSVVDGILLKPLSFSAPEQLFSVRELAMRGSSEILFYLTPGNFLDYRRTVQSADLVCYAQSPFSLTLSNGHPERYPGVLVSEGWFRHYGARIVRGRDFSAEDFEPGRDDAVVLAEGLWTERFARDESLVGSTINLNGRSRRVIGIVESRFDFPAKNKIWAPLAFTVEEAQRRDFHRLMTQGRLRPGYSLEQARAEFSRVLSTLTAAHPAHNANKTIFMEPLTETITGKVKPALLALIGAVGFVLAIACANVANLLLARGAVRRGELAVRVSLGATRGQIVSQLLTESLLFSFLGGLLGLLFAVAAWFAIRYYAPASLPRLDQVAIDGRVALYNFGAVLLTGLLFGLIPAIRLSRVDLHSTLKERTRGGTVRDQFRSLLVVAQVAAALMLMTGAGLLIRSLHQLSLVDLGFAPDHLLTLRVTPLPAKYDEKVDAQIRLGDDILRNLEGLPGLVSAAISTNIPLQGTPRYYYLVEGGPLYTVATAPTMDYFAVTPAYFETMRIPLIAGRAFRYTDNRNAPQVVVVNETFVKLHFPDGRALGRRMQIGLGEPHEWREIVGVAKDVKNDGLDRRVRAQVYAPYFHSPSIIGNQATTFTVVVRSVNQPESLAGAVRQRILAADRSQPVWQVQSMEENIAQTLSQQRFTLFLMAVFAGVAFLLAIIGLSGVVSYTVAQRTREIGIRLAVGAQPGRVLWMVLRHAILLVLAGIFAGIVASLLVTARLESMLYNTSPRDTLTLAVIAFLFLLTAAVSGWVPARRAASIDPAITLRNE